MLLTQVLSAQILSNQRPEYTVVYTIHVYMLYIYILYVYNHSMGTYNIQNTLVDQESNIFC